MVLRSSLTSDCPRRVNVFRDMTQTKKQILTKYIWNVLMYCTQHSFGLRVFIFQWECWRCLETIRQITVRTNSDNMNMNVTPLSATKLVGDWRLSLSLMLFEMVKSVSIAFVLFCFFFNWAKWPKCQRKDRCVQLLNPGKVGWMWIKRVRSLRWNCERFKFLQFSRSCSVFRCECEQSEA